MGTKVHTDITPGAQAAAAIFNAPLGQLDDAISDLELQFGDYVIVGGLPAIPAGLVISQPATRIFLQGIRASGGATNLTAAANSDNYVDFDTAGNFHLTAVANGAAAPPVVANSMRLYKLVTNATGGVSITDLRRMSPFTPFVDVTKAPYNALGDGVTDDTAAIQAAENALAAQLSGGTLYFPPNRTFMASGIIKKSNVHWLGGGFGSTFIKLKNSAPTGTPLVIGDQFATLTGTNPSAAPWGITGFSIRNLTFDGNKANNASLTAPLIQWYAFGYVMDAVCVIFSHTPFYSEWTSNPGQVVLPIGLEARITNCHFQQNDAGSIQWNGPHDSMFENITTENSGTGHSVWVQSKGGAGLWINCHAWGTTDVHWFLDAQSYLLNCEADGGGTVCGAWLRAANIQVIGGAYFGTPFPFQLGVVAGTAASGCQLRGVSIYNASTAAFNFLNDGGNNILEYYSSGGNAAISSGTQAFNTAIVGPIGAGGGQFNVQTNGSVASVAVKDTGGNGANIKLIGNGATTPSKSIRVQSGSLQIMNDAYTAAIAALADTGYLQLAAGLQPGTPAQATQPGNLFMGSGVPSNANGNNGDFYFRTDGTEAGHTLLYHKESGSWVATAA